MIQSVLTLVIIAVSVSSCATVKTKSVDYDYMYINKQGIIQRPLVTDLEVAKEKKSLARTYDNVTVAQAKENIMGEFIKEFTCDLVVQPYFTTTSEGTAVKTTVNVTVNGYPASYRNIRMYEPKDSANFKIRAFVNNYENKPITNESTEEPLKKKKKNIGWIVAGAAALVYLIAAGV